MILTGPEIRKRFDAGDITIDPFDEKQLNPASYDLRLGDHYAVYVFSTREDGENDVLDAKKDNLVEDLLMPPDGLLLRPGQLYLMHTVELVLSESCVPIVDGKSSIGRLGVSVHQTAGFGDPGFDGQYTLEVTCVHPVRLYAGMRICQIRFHATLGEVVLYRGNYTGSKSRGPVPSMSWKQFLKEGK